MWELAKLALKREDSGVEQVQYNIAHYSTIQCNTVNTIQYSRVQ